MFSPMLLAALIAGLAGEPATMTFTPGCSSCLLQDAHCERGLFESDRCFPRFIGPISNPVLAKDPRSLTELRGLFIQNWIPEDHAVLPSGNFQIAALEARVAINERLSFIADKDGYAFIHPVGADSQNGWLNLAAGFKYALIRDVECQFLVTVGAMFEAQTGEADVFQSHGDGLFTIFGTVGKEFDECWHVIANVGYQFPVDRTDNSSMVYTQLHFDRQIFGWLYPLVEFNWYHWTAGGNRGLPAALGEGDGLINFGTSGVAGNNLVTTALGLKAMFSMNLEAGVAYEFPLSNRRDLIDGRILAELIIRY